MTAALRAEERAAPYLVAPPLTDHLDTFANAPEGFKRLRELVLNLAVRGRLVTQSSTEKPLGVGSQKLPQSDTPFGIPSAWRWVRVGEVLKLINGRAFKPIEWLASGLPIVRIQNLNNTAAPFNYCDEATVDSRHFVDDGEFLISWSGTPGTSFGAFIWARGRAALNQHIFKCEIASKEIDPTYLRLAINGRLDEMIAKAHGAVGLQHITKGKLEYLALPFPPLAEQSRIVAKVEELMALIAALEAKVGAGETARGKLLDTLLATLADSPDAAATADAWAQLAPHFDLLLQTPADVDRLQQTLLQLAVKGRLVPQDPSDEPAAELLKRIRAEKERLVAEGKSKRDKSFEPISENAKPFRSPHGWQWVRTADLCASITDGDHLPPPKANEGVPFLVIGDVRDGKVGIESATRFVPRQYFDNLDWSRTPRVGDVLYTTVGSFGIPVPVTERRDFCFQRHIALFRPAMKELQTFFTLLLRSELAFRQAEMGATGIAQKTVPLSTLRSMVLPLPPLPEQSRIVAAVASLTALCDRLRERLAARRALSAKLATALTEGALS